MKNILCLLCIIFIQISLFAEYDKGPKLTSGRWVLSENIEVINPVTQRREMRTYIETLSVSVKNNKIRLVPDDSKSRYFTDARGFINDEGQIEFGFTLLRDKLIFSVIYVGKPDKEKYIKGTLTCIYSNYSGVITGDWAMKPLDAATYMRKMRKMRE